MYVDKVVDQRNFRRKPKLCCNALPTRFQCYFNVSHQYWKNWSCGAKAVSLSVKPLLEPTHALINARNGIEAKGCLSSTYLQRLLCAFYTVRVDFITSLALALQPLIRDSEEFCVYVTQGRENLEFFLVYLIGVRPVTLNGSSSSAVFKFTSNVNVSFSVSLRVRTRQPSTSLIGINQDQNTFFKMEVANGRVRTHYLLEGESGLILSGKSQYSSAQISGNPLYVLRMFYP